MGKILARNTIQPPNISIKYQMKCVFISYFFLFFGKYCSLLPVFHCLTTQFFHSTFGMWWGSALALDVRNRTNSIFSLKVSLARKRSISTWVNFFFCFWFARLCGCWTHSLSSVSVVDSCTDAPLLLANLEIALGHTHTHTTKFRSHSKSFAVFTRKMAIDKFSTVISDYVSNENAFSSL